MGESRGAILNLIHLSLSQIPREDLALSRLSLASFSITGSQQVLKPGSVLTQNFCNQSINFNCALAASYIVPLVLNIM